MNLRNTLSRIDLLRKVTNFTIGFLVNALFFGFIFKLFGGGWIGAGLGSVSGLAAGIAIRKKFRKEPAKKIFGTGVLVSTVILTVIPLVLFAILMAAFQNISG